MLLPIGDNVERKTFPILTVFLILINVCLLLHTETMIANDNEEFEATYQFFGEYGLSPNGLADGNALALITHMFLHNDFMHLVGNMIVLWAMACSLEAIMGRWALLFCYLFWGMIGGFLHVTMDWGSDIPLIGASGAIAGLIGAYTVVFGPLAKVKCLFFFFRPFVVRVPALVFGGVYILMQLMEASGDMGMNGGVSWFTHIGGFFAGAATMLIFRGDVKHKVGKTSAGEVVVDQQGVQSASANLQPAGPMAEDYIAMQVAAAQAEADAAIQNGQSQICVYCENSLGEADYLSTTLARCVNDECQRLNYLETLPIPGVIR